MIAVFIPSEGNAHLPLQVRRDAVGEFEFHPVNAAWRVPALKKTVEVAKLLATACRLRRSNGSYDAIVAHGPYRTGFTGLLLSYLWNIPLIIEFPGHPINGLRLDTSRLGRLKVAVAPYVLRFLIRKADRLRLLYPTQLDGVASAHSSAVASKTCVFHDFVPVSQLSPSKKIPQTILFVGYPWYLKGVDVLIDAFLGLANDFPDAVLKIVGYCPDDRPWRERARYHARVEFLRPMPNVKVAELMSASQIFVLPSRTEAMGRVLLEAMASRSAIVASRVDGIPHYVRDGVDGLLAEPENAPDLEGKLRQLLADPALCDELTANAEQRVKTVYSEKAFAANFHECLVAAIRSR
jgi:glycosyltransferase involved in cell wall biosynthesis